MRSSLNPVVSYRILNPLQGGTSIRPYGPGTSRDCSAVTHQPSSQAEPGSSAPDRVSHRFTTFAKPLSPTRRLQRLPLLFFTHLNRLTLHHVHATWRYVGLPWERGAIVDIQQCFEATNSSRGISTRPLLTALTRRSDTMERYQYHSGTPRGVGMHVWLLWYRQHGLPANPSTSG